ncbi:hypothetical protein [Aliivibrio fischeri]|uniref:hypothetical protein n=1 Tax=Aliivibrio fischeri TaxID=668 RepID=UPI000A8D1645|nr:hypothetical protein [Aliivibrio fischeri]USR97915.1 hypothetical protein AVFI_15735 [Aliivibrio fischeri ATCC 7744 = JCM 18803 = DSM 507]GGK20589.1 hypothetical protein GCM10007987_00650 [Aliivibrio fischeri]
MSMTEKEFQEAIIMITAMRKDIKKTVNVMDPEAKLRIEQKKYDLKLKEIEKDHNYLR